MSDLRTLFNRESELVVRTKNSTLYQNNMTIYGEFELDFSSEPAGAPCAVANRFDSYIEQALFPGSGDAKAWDDRNCEILQIDMYDSTTGYPAAGVFMFGEGRGTNYDWLTTKYCGRIATNLHLITPVVGEGTIDLDLGAPHGLPLNLGGNRRVVVSAGAYIDTTTLTSRSVFQIDSIIDSTTLRLLVDSTNWETQMAQADGQNMYFSSPVIELAGGQAWTSYNIDIRWTMDITHPDFRETVYSDD